MADETQQIPTEAPGLTEPAGPEGLSLDPGMAGAGAPAGADLDSLLAELDSFGVPQTEMPASAPQGMMGMQMPSQNPMAQALEEAAATPRDEDPFSSIDMTSQRVANLEAQLNGMQQKNAALERENVRQGIHNTISEGIDKEMTSLGIDKDGKAGKGLARLIANSVLVSVAQNQAVSGNQSVDPRTIKTTVKNWTKVFSIVAKEMASRQASETRLTSAGSQPAPYKVNKPLGELSEDEFSNAVLANLRGGYNS